MESIGPVVFRGEKRRKGIWEDGWGLGGVEGVKSQPEHIAWKTPLSILKREKKKLLKTV